MDVGGNTHRHNFLKVREVEKQFIDVVDENAEYLRAAEGIDLGAGSGRFSKILSKYIKKLYCVDVSDEAIAAMRINLAGFRNVRIIKAARDTMPFEDGSMDIVFAANSFHDVPAGYEREISRVLNKNGKFVDLDWKKEDTPFGPPLSIRFSEDEVVGKLKKQNFRLIKGQDIGTHYMLIFSKAEN